MPAHWHGSCRCSSVAANLMTRRLLAHWADWKDRRPATYLFDDVETEGDIAL